MLNKITYFAKGSVILTEKQDDWGRTSYIVNDSPVDENFAKQVVLAAFRRYGEITRRINGNLVETLRK